MKPSVAIAATMAPLLFTLNVHAADISGIKLGMSLSEAKAAFASQNNGMKAEKIFTEKMESGFAAYKGKVMISRPMVRQTNCWYIREPSILSGMCRDGSAYYRRSDILLMR